MAEPTKSHALELVAREAGPKAVGLISALMEQSARERESVQGFLMKAMEQERDEWRERALAAEAHLHRIRNRVWDLLD